MIIARTIARGRVPAKAIITNSIVSIPCPTIVDPMALAPKSFPLVHIFIFARTYEFENSQAQ